MALYYYANPLRKVHGARDYSRMNTESPERLPYLKCFCCPPNLVRTVAKSSAWAYSLAGNGLSVNMYGGNKLTTKLQDGSAVTLTQETLYPWDGNVKITLSSCKSDPFEMLLRIPEWAEGSVLKINGEDAGVRVKTGTFAKIDRAWKAGDVIELDMPMEVRLVEGHPRIEEVRNQVAVARGPVVYCIESPDLPENTSILDVYLPSDSKLKAEYKPDFLGGLTVISGSVKLRQDKKDGMYRKTGQPVWKSADVQFVPFYAWSNRGDSEMTVFIPVIWN